MDVSGALTYVATLSVATERVTEFIKRIPGVSNFLSPATKTPGTMEDIRVMSVHVLAVVIGMVLCHYFPQLAPSGLPTEGSDGRLGLGVCFLFGLLASGGSSFWNSALDTFRGVKQKMGN
jgi:hypothetical protein